MNGAEEKCQAPYSKLLKTPADILVFPSLDKPASFKPGMTEQYKARLIVKEDDKLHEFFKEVETIGNLSWPKSWEEGQFDLPVISGVEIMAKAPKAKASLYQDRQRIAAAARADKGAPEMYLRDKSKLPRVTEADLQRIKDTFYPGSICRFIVTAYSYVTGKNQGVALILKGVQFIADGTRLGGEDVASTLDDEIDDTEFDVSESTEQTLDDEVDPSLG